MYRLRNPRAGAIIAGEDSEAIRDLIEAIEPRGSEWGLRLHRRHEGVEYALYAYRGFDKQPLGADAQRRPSHFRRKRTRPRL